MKLASMTEMATTQRLVSGSPVGAAGELIKRLPDEPP